MSVRYELERFVALQRLLLRRAALKREMDTPPEALVELRVSSAARHDALGPRQARRDALLAEQDQVTRRAEALREEREHFRKQKSMVTNMKQLTAVVSELDHVDSELKSREDRLFEIMKELDAIARDIDDLQRETPEEKAARAEAETAWQERRAVAEKELAVVERELRDAQRSLDPPALERFKKLWTARRPHAVVPLDGTSCSACHAELRPSLVQLVRTADSFETCDTCRRLLYDPGQFPAA